MSRQSAQQKLNGMQRLSAAISPILRELANTHEMRRGSYTNTTSQQTVNEMANGQRMITPAIDVRWSSVITPDTRHEKDGVFTIMGLLDPTVAEHEDFLSDLENAWIDGYNAVLKETGKKNVTTHDRPWRPDIDKDGNETGKIAIRPKNKCGTLPSGDAVKVRVFDAALNEVDVEPGNGSTCKLSMWVSPFFHGGKYGLQLRLSGVQVLDLVEFKRTGGFTAEDGFVSNGKAKVADDGFAAAADQADLPF